MSFVFWAVYPSFNSCSHDQAKETFSCSSKAFICKFSLGGGLWMHFVPLHGLENAIGFNWETVAFSSVLLLCWLWKRQWEGWLKSLWMSRLIFASIIIFQVDLNLMQVDYESRSQTTLVLIEDRMKLEISFNRFSDTISWSNTTVSSQFVVHPSTCKQTHHLVFSHWESCV